MTARCPECGRTVAAFRGYTDSANLYLTTHLDRRGRECEGSRMALADAERIGGER